MKWTIVSLLLVVAIVGAEPPRRRLRPLFAPPQRFQRIEAAAPEEPPYPPSGWKPSKPFYLPGEYGGPDGGDTTEAATTEASNAPEETTPAAAPEETTTAAAPANGDDQQGEPTLNVPQDARQLQNAPVFVIIPEKNVFPQQYQQYPQYQVFSDPYTGNYVLQEVTQFPSGYPSQGLVQILKK